MKSRLTGIAGALIASVLTTTSPTFAAEQKLVYAAYHTNASFFMQPALWFLDEVTKRTNGRITFERYLGGTLLKAADVYPGLSRGVADVATGVPAAFNAKDYRLLNISLPFITENPDAATRAISALYNQNAMLRQEFERNNVSLLFALASGENTLWSNEKIQSIDDLRGKRIRSILGIAEAFQLLGATPVSIPWPEGLELFQRGGVDAISATPFDQAVDAGLGDIAKFVSNGGRMGSYGLIVTSINQETWKKLSPEDQKIFREVASEVPQQYVTLFNDVVAEGVRKLKAAKTVSVVPIPEDETARWRKIAAEKVWKKWVDNVSKDGVDGQKLLNEYIKLVRNFEKSSTYVPGLDLYAKQ